MRFETLAIHAERSRIEHTGPFQYQFAKHQPLPLRMWVKRGAMITLAPQTLHERF